MNEDRAGRPLGRRRLIGGLAAIGGLSAVAAGFSRAQHGQGLLPASGGEPADRLQRPLRKRWVEHVIGRSVEGRPILMYANLAERGWFSVMVVAAVHGDERGVGPIGREVLNVPLPEHVAAFAIPVLNPDGWERGDRLNANGVDLNRNFSWTWSPSDGGPAPFSEPETRAVVGVIGHFRPSLVVWVHQPYEYVAAISPTPEAERYARAWGDASGLPYRAGVTQHGGGESWTAMELGLQSILVEAPTREAATDVVLAQRAGYEALLAAI